LGSAGTGGNKGPDKFVRQGGPVAHWVDQKLKKDKHGGDEPGVGVFAGGGGGGGLGGGGGGGGWGGGLGEVGGRGGWGWGVG